jgi:hypothetical protein
LVEEDEELEVPVKEIKMNSGTRREEEEPAPPARTPLKVSPVQRSRALETSGALFMRSVLGARANRVTMRSNSGAGL